MTDETSQQCVARNPDAGGRCQRQAVANERCAHHQWWQPAPEGPA